MNRRRFISQLGTNLHSMSGEAESRSDEQLIRSIVSQGDAQAWRPLLARHHARLQRVCVGMVGHSEADDACQDAMLRIIQGLSSFDFQASFTTWATRVVINACLSRRRSEKVRRAASLDQYLGEAAVTLAETSPRVGGQTLRDSSGREKLGEPIGLERIQYQDEASKLAAAFDRLDADKRAILVLRDIQGLDYGQIAEVLCVSEGTVKSRLFRARQALLELSELLRTDNDLTS